MVRIRFALVTVAAALLWGAAAHASFIKVEIKNAANLAATGFEVMLRSPGTLHKATVSRDVTPLAVIRGASADLGANTNSVVWRFRQSVLPQEKVTTRIEFTPERYWENIFDNQFVYEDESSARGVVPYVGFFIYFTPTSDPNKVLATLTVAKNAQGIDDPEVPIHFQNSEVYINNSLSNYGLERFDHPTGTRVTLPKSFVLAPGEKRQFDLGLVDARSYILTRSTVSYAQDGDNDKDDPDSDGPDGDTDSDDDDYDMECAHSYVDELRTRQIRTTAGPVPTAAENRR